MGKKELVANRQYTDELKVGAVSLSNLLRLVSLSQHCGNNTAEMSTGL